MEDMSKSLPDNYEISDYKISKVIGQGGFGITYLAVDKNLMQEVAIKEYYPREFSNRDSTFTIHAVGKQEDKDTFKWGLERFLEESRILAKLNHPNVVSVKRYFKANGTAYLVMEYCDGKPLDEIIKDHGPLKQGEINVIVSSLLSGLEHVHQNNFLHRDIKPANIFIRKNGQPVLLDFGAAKHDMS
jgi:serine/threonine protein kinase